MITSVLENPYLQLILLDCSFYYVQLPYLPLYNTHPCITRTPKFKTKFWEKGKIPT